MKTLIATIALSIVATTSLAEEISAPMTLNGGIICDTLDDVIALLEKEPAPTCGRLMSAHIGTVTHVAEYEANGLMFNLVRFDFANPLNFPKIQYGWFGKPQAVDPAT